MKGYEKMQSKKCYINKGGNLKEMLNLVVEKFPGEKAFMIKEKGKIRKISFLSCSVRSDASERGFTATALWERELP